MALNLKLIYVISLINLCINKEQIPVYLSIKAETNIARDKVRNFIFQSFMTLLQQYRDDEIVEDFEHLFDGSINKEGTNFTEPDSWHTTCLYIGTNYTQLNTDIYKQFIEDEQVEMLSSTFVYIPKKIMTAVAFYDNYKLIDEKYKHITLLLGSYQAVDSNYVLASLFENENYLKNEYSNGMIEDLNGLNVWNFKNVEIEFKDKTNKVDVADNVYIVKSGNILKMEGLTRKNY